MTEASSMDSQDPQTPETATAARRRQKTVVGTVRRAKMEKTIVVDVVRLELHRRYHKYIRRRTTYKAHDERSEAQAGDLVRIGEVRPISKTKRWRLVEVIRRAESASPNSAEPASPESPSPEGPSPESPSPESPAAAPASGAEGGDA